jgi:hypothetical protein
LKEKEHQNTHHRAGFVGLMSSARIQERALHPLQLWYLLVYWQFETSRSTESQSELQPEMGASKSTPQKERELAASPA